MNVKCPHCGTEYDVGANEMYCYATCEVCGKGFVVGATASLQKDNNAVAKENMHVDVDKDEGVQQKGEHQKTIKNIVESITLLLTLVIAVGCCIWWSSHRHKIEKERMRIHAEAEAERLRLKDERDREERKRREERDRARREQIEKARLERETLDRKAMEERKKREEAWEEERKKQEEERKKQEEACERAERELSMNKDRYQMCLMALKGNEFDLFNAAVTNDMNTAGGELFYLLPSEVMPFPIYLVDSGTNGIRHVFRIDDNGRKDEMECNAFDKLIKNSEYLVTKGSKVYFRSMRKAPWTGLLSKRTDSDPAEAFFDSLTPTIKELRPTYNELTFDINFEPKDANVSKGLTKKIFVVNLEFGCTYSLQQVREAIRNAISVNGKSSVGGGLSNAKKFKRTVRIWNGSHIKQGVDGVTYVPDTPPPERVRHYYRDDRLYPSGHYYRRDSGSYDRWKMLHDKALQEEENERAYHERRNMAHVERQERAKSEANAKLQSMVDEIFRAGTLTYRIRKAKAKDLKTEDE